MLGVHQLFCSMPISNASPVNPQGTGLAWPEWLFSQTVYKASSLKQAGETIRQLNCITIPLIAEHPFNLQYTQQNFTFIETELEVKVREAQLLWNPSIQGNLSPESTHWSTKSRTMSSRHTELAERHGISTEGKKAGSHQCITQQKCRHDFCR